MSSVVEKLAAIEREVAAIQPKMLPLTERITDLDQRVSGFAQQLTSIAEESAAVRQDIELTRQSLARIQTLIGESKTESEQLVAGQEENQQRCETMTAVFGAAFQAMSQFFETAQRMGIADQAKAVFLTHPPESATLTLSQAHSSDVEAESAEVPEELPTTEIPDEESHMSATAEPALSDADFESTISSADEQNLNLQTVPDLPDVSGSTEITHDDLDSIDSDLTSDAEPADEIASHLDVQPLSLSVPALPEQMGPPMPDDTDEQEIEDLLASMMSPVTAAAGN